MIDAVHYCHKPPADADQTLLLNQQHPAQQRLAFAELLSHHLQLLKLRAKCQQHTAPQLKK